MLTRVPKWAWKPLGISALMLAIFMAGWNYGANRVEARIEAWVRWCDVVRAIWRPKTDDRRKK